MSFMMRPPSAAWEPLALSEAPGWPVWAWFMPADMPDGLWIQIPPETLQACGSFLSLRRLVHAAGIAIEQVATWTLQGVAYDAWQGANPLVDHPVPSVSPVGETLIVRLRPMPFAAPAMPAAPHPLIAAPSVPHATGTSGAASAYEAIDADWLAILQIEAQLGLARKQLNTLQSKLQSLNRDLSPEERVVADNQDKRDWQDARRFLRDALGHVSRCMRDHDIGGTSTAGNRNRFEQLYEEVVVPRRPIEGLPALQKEFEQHRKAAQTLLTTMQATHSSASRDGEQKAQQVLQRIAGKVRNARTKK